MPKYGVNLIADAYYEVEAQDREDAIGFAFEMLFGESVRSLYWDCNDVVELESSDAR